jgi:hypothetical protein
VGISDELAEKLSRLDNFQRAEFLRRREVHSECETRMTQLRGRTAALYQKRTNNASAYSNVMEKVGWLVIVVVILEAIFDTMPPISKVGVCIVGFGAWGFFSLQRLMEDHHDEMLFEMLVLEIDRYEHEQRVNCHVNTSYPDDEELAMDILTCLGIVNGSIVGCIQIAPLKPVK